MKFLISIISLLTLLIPSISQARLIDVYQGHLPSIQERSIVYSEIATDRYLGTAKQNNKLESYLLGGQLGATTKIKLTDTNAVTPAATSTPTANMIPIAKSNNILNPSWIATTTAATGSMIYYNGSDYQNLGIGSNYGFLTVSSSLPIWGFYTLGSIATASTSPYLKASADTVRYTPATSYTLLKSINVILPGTITVSHDLCEKDNAAGAVYSKVYINGEARGSLNGTNETTCIYENVTDTLTVVPGDKVQLYAYADSGTNAQIRNFRIYYDYLTKVPTDYVYVD